MKSEGGKKDSRQIWSKKGQPRRKTYADKITEYV